MMGPIFYLCLFCQAWLQIPSQQDQKPNIIFIMADDLGYGDLGCYGQKKIKTPRLDKLATQGIRFTDYYAGSTVCAPSRCVLMTGKHVGHCRVRGNGGGLTQSLRPEDLTVAKVLKQAGYATGLCGKWGLGDEGVAMVGAPTRQGFDFFYGYLNQHHAHNYWPTFLIRNEQRETLPNEVTPIGKDGGGVATKKVTYAPDLILKEAVQFIEANRSKPFFLYFSPILPHANNEANRTKGNGCEVPDLGRYKDEPWTEQNKAQAAMITYLDMQVGQLLDSLEKLGLEKNTVVFFTSDNGPHREGGNQPEFFEASGPFQGIKRSLHDGGIRVPMIVRWPGKIAAGKTTNQMGYHADFLSTACEIAGVKIPHGQDGVSLVPTMKGDESQNKRDFLYWEFYEGKGARAIRLGRWKGVRNSWHGEFQLFDLGKDPAEKNNLASQYPDVVKTLVEGMEKAHKDSPDWPAPKLPAK
ncbi:MAG: arylsulfatase [Gemmataceae bacterium]